MHKHVEQMTGSEGSPVLKDHPGDDEETHHTVSGPYSVVVLPNF
jgi:hypothetical protein